LKLAEKGWVWAWAAGAIAISPVMASAASRTTFRMIFSYP
jgi:hypothetical protein